MDELIQGLQYFQSKVLIHKQDLFQKLAGGQKPEVLFITCGDSRIDPNLITQSEPGELFIIRNAGNIVPPYGSPTGGEEATIEYAVSAVGVQHIVVCGHTLCGAMHAMLHPEVLTELPRVARWLEYVHPALQTVIRAGAPPTDEEREMALIRHNILLQLLNLRTHPAVAAALDAGDLQLHGWLYHLESGEVLVADEATGEFHPIVPAETESLHTGRVARTVITPLEPGGSAAGS